VGLDRSYIGGVERGERNISLENIELVAAALQVSLAELFKGWPQEGGATRRRQSPKKENR
jgi:transcriptional regulator with XRE-family HTH domain